jgi:hypothetical protein
MIPVGTIFREAMHAGNHSARSFECGEWSNNFLVDVTAQPCLLAA